jgi:sugar phosphate isomerase/epimerase
MSPGAMELGIFAKTFPRPDARTTLEAIRARGLQCAQFNLECAGLSSMPEAVPQPTLASIRAASRDTGVRLAALSGTFNMVHPDLTKRKHGLTRLRVVLQAAVELGIPVVTLCTGTRDPDNMWRAHPDNHFPSAWTDLLKTMQEALTAATDAGVTLAIEPEPGNIVSDARSARSLLDTLGVGRRLQVILDPANLWAPARSQADVLAEAFDLLSADLAIAHAKDRTADGSICALGKGVVNFDIFLSHLHSANFAGPLIMHGFAEADAEASVAFLRSRLSLGLPTDVLH